jgi:hypothetical protein
MKLARHSNQLLTMVTAAEVFPSPLMTGTTVQILKRSRGQTLQALCSCQTVSFFLLGPFFSGKSQALLFQNPA